MKRFAALFTILRGLAPVLLILLSAVLLSLTSTAQQPPSLATVNLSAGWASFGQALPQGAAKDGLQLGTLSTQADIKNRWPDGSIRFAVVTAKVTAAGDYPLRAAAPTQGELAPGPAPGFWLAIIDRDRGKTYGVAYYPDAIASTWLAGPLVREGRNYSDLETATNEKHPFLRAVLDVRQYADSTWTFDVCVENCQSARGGTCRYDVYAGVGLDEILFAKADVTHHYLCRWRKVWTVANGHAAPEAIATVTPDLAPAVAAKALPKYSTAIANTIDWVWGDDYEILGKGGLDPYMPGHGGRWEIAPYPDWQGRYLAHRDPWQREYVRSASDLAGSWPIHARGDDGYPIDIDTYPDYWLDDRWDVDGPRGPIAHPVLIPDVAHQPALAFVPFLLTGERFYLDEHNFWAHYCLLNALPGARGSDGWLHAYEVRGMGWAVRQLADAAAYTPDGWWEKDYFHQKLTNNLNMWEWRAGAPRQAGDLPRGYGRYWAGGNGPPEGYEGPAAWTALWAHEIAAWGIHRANEHGISGGETWKNQISSFTVGWLKSTQAMGGPWGTTQCRLGAAPYRLMLSANGNTPLTTYPQASQYWGPVDFAGYYGPNSRAMAVVAGDAAARQWIEQQPGMLQHLTEAAGWFIE